MNKHLNLFYTYGPKHLEDNVTRALIITLKNITPVHLRLFLREVIIPKLRGSKLELQGKVRLLADPNFIFDLQVPEPQENEKFCEGNGLIVGINYSGSQKLDFDTSSDSIGGARPDALVSDSDSELSVIFEAKLWDSLYKEQIQRHYQHFFDPDKADLKKVFVEITWSDIATFLEKVTRQSQSPKEIFVIEQFIEYLDLLKLVEFLSFKNSDFSETNYNYTKLDRFLSFLTERLSEELKLAEYEKNKFQFFFKDISPDNLYFCFDEGCLSCRVVCGSGKKWRAEQLRNYLIQTKDNFKSILMNLNSRLGMDIYLRVHSYFRHSRFRTAWLGNIRGPHQFPDRYEKFCAIFTNPEINSFAQMTKKRINEIFKDEIGQNNAGLDSNNLFPKWDELESFLQYCYFDIDIRIPKDLLIAKTKEELVDIFRKLLSELQSTMLELSTI